jgi:predicted CoA-binding protein
MKIPDLSRDSTYALLGVKRNGKGFGNTLARTLEARGYTFFVVHPEAGSVGDWTAVRHPAELPLTPDAAILCTPASRSRQVLESLHSAGIRRVYAVGGSVDDVGRVYAHDHGMDLFVQCPLLHVSGLGFPHNLHRRLAGLFGG